MYRNKLGVHADSLVGIIHSKPNTRATLGSSDIFLHVMASSKRWNDYSSDNEYAEKILPLESCREASAEWIREPTMRFIMCEHACHISIGVSNTVALSKAFT